MKTILHIGWFKLKSYAKYSFEWNTANILKHGASLIIFGGFAIGVYVASHTVTDYLLDRVNIGQFLFHRLLSMLFFVYFLSINVGNIIVSYATFYRSPETSFYLTKPVSHTQLFLIKFIDNFFYSSTAFFLLAFAVLLGYGMHYHMPWTFYIATLIFLLLPFMLIAGCLAVMILLLLMRFASVIGTKKLIAIISFVYLESLFLYFSFTNPLKLVNQIWKHYPNLDQNFSYLDPAIAKYLPNYWIADSLYWVNQGNIAIALGYIGLLLAATIIVFVMMVWMGKKLFYSSWLASLELLSGKKHKAMRLNLFSMMKKPVIGIQSSILLRKDITQFIREPSQWIHFLIISVLVGTFMVSMAHINLRQSLPMLQTVSYLVVLLFNAFLVASIALRFIFPAMSLEGMSVWKVITSPVQRQKIFWLKLSVGLFITILLSESLVVFSHWSLAVNPVLQSTALLIMIGIAFFATSVNMGIGTYFADYREKNPIRIASSQSATLAFILCIIYLALVVAVMFIPYLKYFTSLQQQGESTNTWMMPAALIILFGSIIMGGASIIMGVKALKRDFAGS
jgi:ABC-2 type transport system permease protein